MQLQDCSQAPFTADLEVAVALQKVEDSRLHAGVLYTSDGKALFMHFAWHKILRNEEVPQECYWLKTSLPIERARQVANVCRLVARQRLPLPYGFSSPDTIVLDVITGKTVFGPTFVGLTCASFVAALFAWAGLPLLDPSSWKDGNEEDVKWQKWAVELLKKHRASEAHVSMVSATIGNARFRPEEVASASCMIPPPVTFDSVQEPSRLLRAKIFPS